MPKAFVYAYDLTIVRPDLDRLGRRIRAYVPQEVAELLTCTKCRRVIKQVPYHKQKMPDRTTMPIRLNGRFFHWGCLPQPIIEVVDITPLRPGRFLAIRSEKRIVRTSVAGMTCLHCHMTFPLSTPKDKVVWHDTGLLHLSCMDAYLARLSSPPAEPTPVTTEPGYEVLSVRPIPPQRPPINPFFALWGVDEDSSQGDRTDRDLVEAFRRL